jgi:transcriptional regulator with XRE-family HTH domain
MARYTKDVSHPLNQEVAAELRAELARHRDLTQQDIVERSGLPVNTVGKIFRGEAMIDVRQLELIALALHTDPHTIVARAEHALDSKQEPPPPSAKRRRSG